jgi:hypothetical protein
VLRASPRLDAAVRDTATVQLGEKLSYDSTRYQTTVPGVLTATAPAEIHGRFLGAIRYLSERQYYSDAYRDTTLRVIPPDTVEFLQHRAEGTCFVRVRGRVLDAQECPALGQPGFVVRSQPSTRWWIHVRLADRAGWVIVSDSTARVVERRF